MSSRIRSMAMAALMGFGLFVWTGSGGASASPEPEGAENHALLAQVRAATAKYHNVEVAERDGYAEMSPCDVYPEGGMGIHWVHLGRLDTLDPLRPAALHYEPTPHGVRLVAVEYFKADADQDLSTTDDRPSMFGQPFDGPHAAHAPGWPAHYELHAWIWKHNPSGMFKPWNPRVRCP